MTIKLKRRLEFFLNTTREPCCFPGVSDQHLDNGKLITAQACDGITAPHAGAQPNGNCLEEFVADRMAKCVVDVFEVIKIETKHRYLTLAPPSRQCMFEPIAKTHPIREI